MLIESLVALVGEQPQRPPSPATGYAGPQCAELVPLHGGRVGAWLAHFLLLPPASCTSSVNCSWIAFNRSIPFIDVRPESPAR